MNYQYIIGSLFVLLSNHAFSATNYNQIASFKKYDDFIIIPIKFNGNNYNFVLDTASKFTIFDKDLINENDKTGEIEKIENIDKSYNYNKINKLEIDIGNEKILLNNIVYDDLSKISEVKGYKISGILGSEVRRKFVVFVDNSNGKIELYKNNYFKNMICIPYNENESGIIGLKVQLDSKDFFFGLDTASNTSTIYEKNIQKIKMENIDKLNFKSRVTTLNHTQQYNNYNIKSLTLNKDKIGDLFFVDSNRDINLLGTNFLSKFKSYLIDPYSMEFCYQGIDNKEIPKPFRNLAIIKSKDNNYIFKEDYEGLMENDILISLNNKNVDKITLNEIRKTLNFSNKIKIKVNRNGKILKINLN